MLSTIVISMALALGALALDADQKVENLATQSEQSGSDAKRLSSDEIARIRAGSVPSNCEVFWLTDPVTGEERCDAVVCRTSGGFPSIHECSEFGL